MSEIEIERATNMLSFVNQTIENRLFVVPIKITNCVLRNCTFVGMRINGDAAVNGLGRNYILDCTFKDLTMDCIHFYGTGTVISDCRFYKISSILPSGVATGWHIDIFQSSGEPGHGFRDISIRGCSAIDCNCQLMNLSQDDDQTTGDVVVSDCYFEKVGTQANIMAPRVDFLGCTFIQCNDNNGYQPVNYKSHPTGGTGTGSIAKCLFKKCHQGEWVMPPNVGNIWIP
jgi:hypothetical protein